MSSSLMHPPVSRVVSLLWFPFFFVVAFSLMGFFAFSAPTPHGVHVDVVGSRAQVDAARTALMAVQQDGFFVTAAGSAAAAREDLRSGSVTAAYVPGAAPQVLTASAGSAPQANYLAGVFTRIAAPAAVTRVDVVPSAAGDVSGVSILFVGLPLMLVGLITALVLLRFAMWSIPVKALVLAASGAFSTVFVYLVAIQLDLIPKDEWLLLYGFLLTQTIGWIATGAAAFVRQFFLPFAMTFVLILQIPTAGATVAGDMLPAFDRWLNGVMPLGRFFVVARSSAYFGDHGLVGPLLALIGWALIGAALMTASHLVALRRARSAAAESEREAAEIRAETIPHPGAVHGTVRTTVGAVVLAARVVLVDERNPETARVRTDPLGRYRIDAVQVGLHHLLVSAPHCEPVVVTIAVYGTEHDDRGRDVTLVDWDDPAANLAAEDVVQRDALTASARPALGHRTV